MSGKESPYEVDCPQVGLRGSQQVSGNLDASGLRFGLAVSRYNATLTGQLSDSAVRALVEKGADEADVLLAWVPGAYEIPSVLERMAQSGKFDALLALGVVIQGETPHAGLINQQVSQSLADISRAHGLPVLDGVIPARDPEQAEVRCDPGQAARGRYLAYAAIEMARVFQSLDRTLS
jgi:6,7-dimethyl-8-ribityllumazine synthase